MYEREKDRQRERERVREREREREREIAYLRSRAAILHPAILASSSAAKKKTKSLRKQTLVHPYDSTYYLDNAL